MAVVVFGVTSSDIDLAVSWLDIDTNSEPTSARVSAMITNFSGPLNLALEAAGISPSGVDSGSALYSTLAGHIIRRVGAEVVFQNQREASDYTSAATEQWQTFLDAIQAGQFSALGTDTPPASNVQGAFNSPTIVTAQPSSAPRLGYWRKGIGFN